VIFFSFGFEVTVLLRYVCLKSVGVEVGQKCSGLSVIVPIEGMIKVPVVTASAMPARPCPLLFRGFPFQNDFVVLWVLIVGELGMCSD